MEKISLHRDGRLAMALLFLAVAGYAAAPEETFKQGNAAYASGQFAAAMTQYESARGEGLNHWALHYNLGNAYYKTGQLGKAVASYLRAFHLNSSQRDVVHNLNLALTKAGDPLLPSDALSRLFWRMFYLAPVNVLTALTSFAFIICCLMAGLFFWGLWRPPAKTAGGRSPDDWRPPASVGLYCFLVFMGLAVWFGARAAMAEKSEAVVISGTAEVRSGPDASYPANFTVPEGRRVLILKQQEPIKGWLEIGVPQEGLKGWTPEASVEILQR